MAARLMLSRLSKSSNLSAFNTIFKGDKTLNVDLRTSAKLLSLNAPAKPRKTALSSYQIFMKEQLDKRAGEDTNQAQLFKDIAAQWRNLDEEEKEHYRTRSDIEKESWMRECAVYEAYLDSLSEVERTRIELKELLLKADAKERKRITRKAVDDVAVRMPKKPGSIFQLFLSEEIQQGKLSGLNGPALFRAASEKWKTIEDSKKEELKHQRNKLYEKYLNDLEVWKNS